MHIEPANLSDLPAILEIQKAAFREELALYGPGHHPPLVETVEDLRREYFFRSIPLLILPAGSSSLYT